MKPLPLIACLLTSTFLATAQTTVLYQQDFGTPNGGNTLATVGWSQILPPAGYSGIYAQPGAHDGNTSAPLPVNTLFFGGNAGSGIFFTTNGAGSGTGGNSAFTSINPTLYTNLNLSIWSQWSFQGANLKCWFAVQVGGTWYISTNHPITTLQQSAGNTFYVTTLNYNPATTNWNYLTNTTVVAVGPPAASPLSGNITGIGIVAILTGSGSWDYNNFLITSVSNTVATPPTINAPPISQTNYTGAGVSFAVNSTGTAPFTYTWLKDGTPLSNGGRISGATTNQLNIANIDSGDAGAYSVIVSNTAGYDASTNYSTATLTVLTVPNDVLYAETFPFVGPLAIGYPVSVVGWSNAIPDNPNRLYQNSGGDGAAFAFEPSANTNLFYVTTNSDNGASGLKFPKITPGSYPAVSFSADIAPSYQPANVAAYCAVQINGSAWYVSTTPLSVDTTTATGTFTTYRQQFDPLAANWNTLTINATTATIGAAAGSNLTGDITGAGLVFVYTGAGNFNLDNFLVTTNAAPSTAPAIVSSPFSQTVQAGGGVSFTVAASGTKPFAYFWQKDSNPLSNGGRISGANSNVLTIINLNTNDQGTYSCIVSNSAGTDNTANYLTTVLTVNDTPVGLLYFETFPYVGPGIGGYPLTTVGWNNAIPNNPDRLFQNAGGDGAAFAFQGSAATTAFFATPGSDPGTSGLPFPNITLAFYPNPLFSVDIAPTTASSNVTAAIAVQINNGQWYVSSTQLPVDTSVDTTLYSTYTQAFNATAANWKSLTLVAGNGATVGATATTNLSGSISGAGLVFTHSGTGGTFNFDNFQITSTGIGGVNVGTLSGSSLPLSWVGNPHVHLQSATNLVSPVSWQDVPNTAGQNSITVQATTPHMFFRLVTP